MKDAMISVYALSSTKEENQILRRTARQYAQRYSEDDWEFYLFESVTRMEEVLTRHPLVNLLSWDLSLPGGLESLERWRPEQRDALLLLVVEASMSPAEYIKPGILPSALLIKPMREDTVQPALKGMLGALTQKLRKDTDQPFLVETREGTQYIPYDRIRYFEAKEKKVFVRADQEEFGFYRTLDELEKTLPKPFVRCHRAFIVNMDWVESIQWSNGLLQLDGAVTLPLSRSYKEAVKEYGNG